MLLIDAIVCKNMQNMQNMQNMYINQENLGAMKKKLLENILLNSSQIGEQDLSKGEDIYEGFFCNVRAIEKNGSKYAVKMIKKIQIEEDLQKQLKYIKNEIKILSQCKHVNLIELLGSFETEHHIVLVFPYFGKSLDSFIKRRKKKSEERAYRLEHFMDIFRQICAAVFEIHVKGFIHRDISADNILIDEDYRIKLIDFGSCNVLSRNRQTKIGTQMYLAPEIIQKKNYNHKVDVWALGILSYQLIYGVYLFRTRERGLSDSQIESQYIQNMTKEIPQYEDAKLLIDRQPPPQVLNQINCMLHFNPNKRPQIGYLLNLEVFGAKRAHSEKYVLEEYIRRKTERKNLTNLNIMSDNLNEMDIKSLEYTLFNLVSLHTTELIRQKALLLKLSLTEEQLLATKRKRLMKNEE